MQFTTLTYTVNHQSALITLNRPQVYNALNDQGKHELIDAIKAAQHAPEVHTIILTGEGKAFCSGQDLNDRAVDARLAPVDIGDALETGWNPLVNSLRFCDKPVIAAINGVAAGAGLSIALSCDLRIAAPAVRFIAGFTQIGLAPDAGLSYQLVRAMGYSRAFSFALKSKALLAEEMLSFGLLNEIHDTPLERALELAQELNLLAPLAVRATKRNFSLAMEGSWFDVLEAEKKSQRALGFSADYKEGVTAFLEKRAPRFQGV